MTSLLQMEANNAIRSTGPSTDEGKCRSRRNVIRHGLCAETVIEMVEGSEDHRVFEAAIIAVERELVLRLASLLWRLRRATSIETDLLRIPAEILRDRRENRRSQRQGERPQSMRRLRVLELGDEPASGWNGNRLPDDDPISLRSAPVSRDLAHSFQWLANFDNGVFERLGRYATALPALLATSKSHVVMNSTTVEIKMIASAANPSASKFCSSVRLSFGSPAAEILFGSTLEHHKTASHNQRD
jgi:hypothetical protein